VKNLNIFCFGFGQVAKNFINKINLKKYNINLSTTSRSETSKKTFNGIEYQNYLLKDKNYDYALISKLKESDHILISIPPIEEIDIVTKQFSKYIKESKAKWITYLSATSVYGNHDGCWVDENSKTKPTTKNGISRLKAENEWISLKRKYNLPIQVLRLSGIYSNKENILARLRSGTAKLVNKKNHYFSRIHVDDIGNILFESLTKFRSGEIYNLSDDKPTSSQEITLYGAKLLNIENIEVIEVEDIESKMVKNFYKDSKKINNKKMKEFFNYRLKFPTYVEGLNYIKNNFI
jgi:nucleoside-diphosphate-sugar epimerase|tara:strand:- start:1881 stop:2756 length:876 start_codon:yes stop_codon:yes gene_type:complete